MQWRVTDRITRAVTHGFLMMSDEREQIRILLLRPTLWSDEQCVSDEMTAGISIHFLGKEGSWSWKVIWPDQTESHSDRKFDNWLDVRIDLRAFLTKRLAKST